MSTNTPVVRKLFYRNCCDTTSLVVTTAQHLLRNTVTHYSAPIWNRETNVKSSKSKGGKSRLQNPIALLTLYSRAGEILTPLNSGRTQRSSFCGKKSEAIPQKLRSVERSTIAKQSVLLVIVILDHCCHFVDAQCKSSPCFWLRVIC